MFTQALGPKAAGIISLAASPALAGLFQGNVQITGTVSNVASGFIIDHPLDPANQYLRHASVESAEMMNLYSGNVICDANGEATVVLPAWFEALNRDFRYQLTSIGAPCPTLYIAVKIQKGRFKVKGGTSGLEVSWQVTGVRQDAWVQANHVITEEAKADSDKGRYLHPEAFGQPLEREIHDTMGLRGQRLLVQHLERRKNLESLQQKEKLEKELENMRTNLDKLKQSSLRRRGEFESL